MSANRRGHLALLLDELKHTRELVKEGYTPRNRQLEPERAQAENQTSIAETQGNIMRARH